MGNKAEICTRIKKILAEMLFLETVEITDQMSLLEDLGIDSLDLIDLGCSVGRAFEVDIPFQKWTEGISMGVTRFGVLGPQRTLQEISENTGLLFLPGDLARLEELKTSSYEEWDLVRTILGFIRVSTMVNYVQDRQPVID